MVGELAKQGVRNARQVDWQAEDFSEGAAEEVDAIVGEGAHLEEVGRDQYGDDLREDGGGGGGEREDAKKDGKRRATGDG